MQPSPSPTSCSAGAEELLGRFEEAWRCGSAPRLEQFLPPQAAAQSGDAARFRLLRELIKIDLEYRWRNQTMPAARQARLEIYLERYPELRQHDAVLPELIGEEYWARQHWGDRPAHGEYALRFPGHWPTLQATLQRIDSELAREFGERSARVPAAAAPPVSPIPAGDAVQPIAAVSQLMEALRQYSLVSAVQLDELVRQLATRATAPRDWIKELVQRNWLTPYQANQLAQGRAHDLLLGSYLLLRRLGEGGAGQVFLARHQRMDRVVALKLLRRELLADAEVVGRFYREVQVLSKLDHPNVVHAYDAGPVRGTHFLAMEYVEGTDLGRLVKQNGPMPALQACVSIRQAALGLQHAHERGLVHRDIKPHNLIMSVRDGLIKVADLGLARLPRTVDQDTIAMLSGVQAGATLTPQNALLMGTADFLAPEQALNFHAADIRADIYSLGCTLYHLLAGQPPFAGGTMAEKLLKHQQAEPVPVDRLRTDLPLGLPTVLLRMLAKRPEDRYQTPAEVAAALAALTGTESGITLSPAATGRQPPSDSGDTLIERPPPAVPVTRRKTRHPRLVATLGLVVLGLGLAGAVLLSGGRSLSTANQQADVLPAAESITEADLKKIESRMQDFAGQPEPLRQTLLAVRRIHAGQPLALRATELLMQLPSALDALEPGQVNTADGLAVGQPDGLVAVLGDGRLRQWGMAGGIALSPDGALLATTGQEQAVRVWDSKSGKNLHTFAATGWPRFSPDGQLLAAFDDYHGTLRLWNPVKGTEAAVPAGRVVGLSPDLKLLACRGADERQVRLLDLTSGKELVTCSGHEGVVRCVAFSADGKRAVSGGRDRLVLVWETTTGNLLATLKGHTSDVTVVALSSDGQTVAAQQYDGGLVKLWDVTTTKELQTFPGPGVWALAPDGKTLALRSDRGVRLWDVAAGRDGTPVLRIGESTRAIVFSADSRLVATGTKEGRLVRLWDVATGAERAVSFEAGSSVSALAFSADGQTLASANERGTYRIWDVASGRARSPTMAAEWYTGAVCSPDGRTLALVDHRLTVHLWDCGTGQRRVLGAHQHTITALVFAADGQALVSVSSDGDIKVFDVSADKLKTSFRDTDSVTHAALSADGRMLATAGYAPVVKVWDTSTGQLRATFVRGAATSRAATGSLAFAPGGTIVAWGSSEDGTLALCDLGSKQPRLVAGPRGFVDAAFTPDGQMLAIRRGHDNSVALRELATGKEQPLPERIDDNYSTWAVGRTVATGSNNGRIRVFDLAGQPRATLEGHADRVRVLAYAPDGELLASAGQDNRIIVWDPTSRKPKVRQWQLPGPVLRLAWAADGRHLATVNANGTVCILRASRP
jgi:WD40 repeat protein/serine/threonine protein kinase